MSEAVIIAIIGAVASLVAALFLKILEKGLGRAKERQDRAGVFRNELRTELERAAEERKALKEELDLTEKSEDRWRRQYWSLFERFFRIRLIAILLAKDDDQSRSEIDRIQAPHEEDL